MHVHKYIFTHKLLFPFLKRHHINQLVAPAQFKYLHVALHVSQAVLSGVAAGLCSQQPVLSPTGENQEEKPCCSKE